MAARRSAEVRREEILRATIRLVTAKGFGAVTLRDVAAEVGVAHGLLRHYFAGRDELLAAAFDLAATEEVADLDAEVGDDWTATTADLCRPPTAEHYLLWIDAWSEAPRSPRLAETLRRHHLACETTTRTVIERGVTAGAYSCADAAATARTLTAVLDGLAVQLFSLGLIDRAEHDRLALAQAEALLGLPTPVR